MEIDKTTIDDLSIFNSEEEFSVFSKINQCVTIRGKEQLRRSLGKPLESAEDIREVQKVLKFIIREKAHWPSLISNGTVMVVERFFESNISAIPSTPSKVSAMSYKIINGHDYSLVRYSVNHYFDLVKGMQQMVDHFIQPDTPELLTMILQAAQKIIGAERLAIIGKYKKSSEMPPQEMLYLGHFFRYHYKNNMISLLSIFAQLDAWYGMAMAVIKYELIFPEIVDSHQPVIDAKGLYHILLREPVPYDVSLDKETNFLFLTGANMAGKSTFIKAVGSAVFLAHIGMGVPATSMRLSVFDGMLSNINVIDNIMKGESYFFNEVQRIKATVSKISDGRKWLILIDELFKGTNVQDAMKCSLAVIEGLLKIKNSLFILSTHLYEIGDDLKGHPNITFNYFETSVVNDQLNFNYQLKSGISNDRLGYLILKKEGVVKMLEEL